MADEFDGSLEESLKDLSGDSVRKGKFLRLMNIIEEDVNLTGVFGFNQMSNDVVWMVDAPIFERRKNDLVTDIDEVSVSGYLTKKYNLSPSSSDINKVITFLSLARKFHPIRNWLENLKWDGVPRLDTWLINVAHTEDSPYSRAISRKILVAAVARTFKPGIKFDHMLILEGQQGIYKSTLVSVLGGEWYAPLILTHKDSDLVDTMRGRWFMEIEELAGMGKREVEYIRAFISRKVDRVRLSYGRRVSDYPRQCVFIGTLNPDGDNQYLMDYTGGRRFWPIELSGKIDIRQLEDIREQLFAEAVVAFKAGENLWLDSDIATTVAQGKQHERTPDDLWTEVVLNFLKTTPKTKFFVHEILTEAFHISADKMTHSHKSRVGRIMKKFSNWQYRRGPAPARTPYYIPPGYVEPDGITENLIWTDTPNTPDEPSA